MKKNKIVFGLIIVVVVIFIVLLSQNMTSDQKAIKIGFIGPLSGDVSSWGLSARNSIEIAIEEINAQSDIQFEVVYEDGRCVSQDAVTAIHKLINVDKIDVAFVVCSSETLAIAPITEENKILLFSESTHKDLPSLGDYIFRVTYSDALSAEVAAEVIRDKYSRVGVIYELTAYPEGLKNAFVDSFESLGGEVFVEGFTQGASDMRTQITKLLAENIEAIFVNPDGIRPGIDVLKQLKEFGFEGQVFGNYFGGNKDTIKAKEAEGMIFFGNPVVEESEAKAKLFEKYKELYGENPSIELSAVTSYDAIYILKQAIDETNGYDLEKVKDYLIQTDNLMGIMGQYDFDEQGEVGGIKPSINQIKEGKAVAY